MNDKTDMGGRGRCSPLYCGHCKKRCGPSDDDPCIEALPGDVMNACCGHGKPNEAYVQRWGGASVRGDEALAEMRVDRPDAGKADL